MATASHLVADKVKLKGDRAKVSICGEGARQGWQAAKAEQEANNSSRTKSK